MPLDDINPESWRKLLAATTDYCARPEIAAQFDELGAVLAGTSAGGSAGRLQASRPSAAAVNGGVGGWTGNSSGMLQRPHDSSPVRMPTVSAAGAPAAAGSPLSAPQPAPRPSAGGTTTTTHRVPAPRLGTAKGVLLVEAPRSGFPEAASQVETAAAAAARLPQLLRRCCLTDVGGPGAASVMASTQIHSSSEGGAAAADQQQQQQQHQRASLYAQPQQLAGSWPMLGALKTTGASNLVPASSNAAAEAAASRAAKSAAASPVQQQMTAAVQPEGLSDGGGAKKQQEGASASPAGGGGGGWLASLLSGMSGGGAGAGNSKKEAPVVSDAGSDDPRGGHSSAAAEPMGAASSRRVTASDQLQAHASTPGASPPLTPRDQADLQGGWRPGGQGAAHAAAAESGSGAEQQLVAAVASALQAVAGQVGVVHLALHATSKSQLVGAWGSRVFAVIEPSAEAERLANDWAQSVGGRSGGASSGAVCSLAQLLAGRACVELGEGSLLSVLSQQRVRTPQGQLVTSWMFEMTEPRVDALLDAQLLLPVASQMSRVVVVSASPLPMGLTQVLLRAGARAIVSADVTVGPVSWKREEVEGFFAELYNALLCEGATVPDALAAAEAAQPTLQGAFVCHHL